MHNKRTIVDDARRSITVDGTQLTIRNSSDADVGEYRCLASAVVDVDHIAVLSSATHLYVEMEPRVVPADATVFVGESVRFECRFASDEAAAVDSLLNVSWTRDQRPINLNNRIQV